MAGNNVPGLDSTPQFSQNVPGVAFPLRGAQEAGQGIERAGAGLEQAGQTIGQISEQIQRQHDVTTAAAAATDLSVKHNQLREQIAMSSPDGLVRDPQTKDIITNRDGTQKTIAQQYWETADQDYQNYQNNMTPGAAAMFRERVQETIAANTRYMQGEGLRKQAQNANDSVSAVKDTFSKDFDRGFVPVNTSNGYFLLSGGYYEAPGENGSTRQFPSAQKLYDAVQGTQLLRYQLGPVQGKPGLYGQEQVNSLSKGDGSELAENWLTSAKQDLVEANGSRAALHQNLKDASSTSVMQVNSLLDLVNGKDPESLKRVQDGKATVNSLLTPDQIHKWNNDLMAMLPAAKEVDKHEYELQKDLLEKSAHGTKSIDQFILSPLFQKTVAASGGLGLPTAERIKDLVPSISQAITSAAMSSIGNISSPEAMRAAAEKQLQHGEKFFTQFAQMMGEKDASGFSSITDPIRAQVAAKLQETKRQIETNPLGYAAGIKEGPQGPRGTVRYKDPTQHYLETALDPRSGDPSAQAIFKKGPDGKSLIETAQKSAANIYSRVFNSKEDVSILQPQQFKDQAQRLVQAKDTDTVNKYFESLSKSNLTPQQQQKFVQDLVRQGGLPQTYADAMTNLVTPAERATRIAQLKAGPAPMPPEWTPKQLEQAGMEHNKNLFAFKNLEFGPSSPEARTALKDYLHTWQEDAKQAKLRGMTDSQAYAYADEQRNTTTGAVGIVGAQHSFLGLFNYGHSGPQVLVDYGSNKYTPEQQQNIRDSLLHAQQKETLAQYYPNSAPGALPPNPNAPTNAENIAKNAAMWRKEGTGWRLYQNQVDSGNRSMGKPIPVQVPGVDGNPRYYEVRESDALAGPPPGSPKSVAPSTIEMGPAKIKDPMDSRHIDSVGAGNQGSATDVMARNILGINSKTASQQDLAKFELLRTALKNKSEPPRWLEPKQLEQYQQFFEQTRD